MILMHVITRCVVAGGRNISDIISTFEKRSRPADRIIAYGAKRQSSSVKSSNASTAKTAINVEETNHSVDLSKEKVEKCEPFDDDRVSAGVIADTTLDESNVDHSPASRIQDNVNESAFDFASTKAISSTPVPMQADTTLSTDATDSNHQSIDLQESVVLSQPSHDNGSITVPAYSVDSADLATSVTEEQKSADVVDPTCDDKHVELSIASDDESNGTCEKYNFHSEESENSEKADVLNASLPSTESDSFLEKSAMSQQSPLTKSVFKALGMQEKANEPENKELANKSDGIFAVTDNSEDQGCEEIIEAIEFTPTPSIYSNEKNEANFEENVNVLSNHLATELDPNEEVSNEVSGPFALY